MKNDRKRNSHHTAFARRMTIKKSDVQNVSISVGMGFTAHPGVRRWMQSKGFKTYLDYARAYKCVPRDEVQREIERFTFA